MMACKRIKSKYQNKPVVYDISFSYTLHDIFGALEGVTIPATKPETPTITITGKQLRNLATNDLAAINTGRFSARFTRLSLNVPFTSTGSVTTEFYKNETLLRTQSANNICCNFYFPLLHIKDSDVFTIYIWTEGSRAFGLPKFHILPGNLPAGIYSYIALYANSGIRPSGVGTILNQTMRYLIGTTTGGVTINNALISVSSVSSALYKNVNLPRDAILAQSSGGVLSIITNMYAGYSGRHITRVVFETQSKV